MLGEQTRPHGDLDLVVLRTNLDEVVTALLARNFKVMRDLLPTAIALRDEQGREADLHPVDPTDDGGGDQVLGAGVTWHYAPLPSTARSRDEAFAAHRWKIRWRCIRGTSLAPWMSTTCAG